MDDAAEQEIQDVLGFWLFQDFFAQNDLPSPLAPGEEVRATPVLEGGRLVRVELCCDIGDCPLSANLAEFASNVLSGQEEFPSCRQFGCGYLHIGRIPRDHLARFLLGGVGKENLVERVTGDVAAALVSFDSRGRIVSFELSPLVWAVYQEPELLPDDFDKAGFESLTRDLNGKYRGRELKFALAHEIATVFLSPLLRTLQGMSDGDGGVIGKEDIDEIASACTLEFSAGVSAGESMDGFTRSLSRQGHQGELRELIKFAESEPGETSTCAYHSSSALRDFILANSSGAALDQRHDLLDAPDEELEYLYDELLDSQGSLLGKWPGLSMNRMEQCAVNLVVRDAGSTASDRAFSATTPWEAEAMRLIKHLVAARAVEEACHICTDAPERVGRGGGGPSGTPELVVCVADESAALRVLDGLCGSEAGGYLQGDVLRRDRAGQGFVAIAQTARKKDVTGDEDSFSRARRVFISTYRRVVDDWHSGKNGQDDPFLSKLTEFVAPIQQESASNECKRGADQEWGLLVNRAHVELDRQRIVSQMREETDAARFEYDSLLADPVGWRLEFWARDELEKRALAEEARKNEDIERSDFELSLQMGDLMTPEELLAMLLDYQAQWDAQDKEWAEQEGKRSIYDAYMDAYMAEMEGEATERAFEEDELRLMARAGEFSGEDYSLIQFEDYAYEEELETKGKEVFGAELIEELSGDDVLSLDESTPEVDDGYGYSGTHEYEKKRDELFPLALDVLRTSGSPTLPALIVTPAAARGVFGSISHVREDGLPIGLLVIAGAERMLPSEVAGLMARSRRALSVGDVRFEADWPVPEYALACGTIIGTDAGTSRLGASVQSVADAQNVLGHYLSPLLEGERTWVGLPLFGEGPSEGMLETVPGDMRCVSVFGTACGPRDLFVQNQGRWVQEHIEALCLEREGDCADLLASVFVMSPFQTVVQGLRKGLTRPACVKGGAWEAFLDDNVGVVSDFRDRRTNEVVLVLGCDSTQLEAMGSIHLRVVYQAMSSSMRRFFLVGDECCWALNPSLANVPNAFGVSHADRELGDWVVGFGSHSRDELESLWGKSVVSEEIEAAEARYLSFVERRGRGGSDDALKDCSIHLGKALEGFLSHEYLPLFSKLAPSHVAEKELERCFHVPKGGRKSVFQPSCYSRFVRRNKSTLACLCTSNDESFLENGWESWWKGFAKTLDVVADIRGSSAHYDASRVGETERLNKAQWQIQLLFQGACEGGIRGLLRDRRALGALAAAVAGPLAGPSGE